MAYLEQSNARTINAIVATANGDDAHARILIAERGAGHLAKFPGDTA